MANYAICLCTQQRHQKKKCQFMRKFQHLKFNSPTVINIEGANKKLLNEKSIPCIWPGTAPVVMKVWPPALVKVWPWYIM